VCRRCRRNHDPPHPATPRIARTATLGGKPDHSGSRYAAAWIGLIDAADSRVQASRDTEWASVSWWHLNVGLPDEYILAVVLLQ
jgi:hypothetical protein